MRRIIYTRPDGGLSVVRPIINTHPNPENITEAEAEQRAWDRLPSNAINPKFIEESAVPSDRTFRDAWMMSGNGIIEHDMEKCRAIHRQRLRTLRAPLLIKLDVEYMKALEAGDQSQCAAIEDKKNSLRNVTDDHAVDSASTPEELKTIIPKCLSQT